MSMFNFSKKDALINANWFMQDGHNYIKSLGGEKALAVYLNLQRFIRYDFDDHRSKLYYMTSVKKILESVNEYGQYIDVHSVYRILKKLQKYSIIDIVSHPHFKDKYKKNLSSKELLVIEDLDYMDSTYYADVPFDIVRYILDNGYSYKQIALYLFMKKWSNNPEGKCFISVNKLASWIGYSNTTILKYYRQLNQLGVMVTYKKSDEKGHTRYDHYLLDSMDHYDEFQDIHNNN